LSYPGSYSFSYYRGDTYQTVLRPKNSNGTAFALTGYTALFVIANVRGSAGVQISATAVVDTVNNLVTCTSVGRNLLPGSYVYDVQITNGASNILTILTGTISVTDDISGAV
jgi:hypothetical protein